MKLRKWPPTTHKNRICKWQARICHTVKGVRVSGVRRRGTGLWRSAHCAPPEVRDYLALDEENYIDGFKNIPEMVFAGVALKIKRKAVPLEAWHNFDVTEKKCNLKGRRNEC